MKKSLFFLVALSLCKFNAMHAEFTHGGHLTALITHLEDFTNTKSGIVQTHEAFVYGKFINEGAVTVAGNMNVTKDCTSFESAGNLKVQNLRFTSDKTAIKLKPQVIIGALYKGHNNLGSITFTIENATTGYATLKHSYEGGVNHYGNNVDFLAKKLEDGLAKAQNATELNNSLWTFTESNG